MRMPKLPPGGFASCTHVDRSGNRYYAEIEPSAGAWYRQWLPWVRRWWYEIVQIEQEPSNERGARYVSHAYTPNGSGGAWTLRGCLIKARRSIESIAEEADNRGTGANGERTSD